MTPDVLAVTRTLGWSRFAVWGGSGGAPHALAIAATLPDQVTACASVVGLAPFNTPGLDWFAGMSPANVEEFRFAARGEAAYRPLVARLAADAIAAIEAGWRPDRVALATRQAEPDFRERMRATYIACISWVRCHALLTIGSSLVARPSPRESRLTVEMSVAIARRSRRWCSKISQNAAVPGETFVGDGVSTRPHMKGLAVGQVVRCLG